MSDGVRTPSGVLAGKGTPGALSTTKARPVPTRSARKRVIISCQEYLDRRSRAKLPPHLGELPSFDNGKALLALDMLLVDTSGAVGEWRNRQSTLKCSFSNRRVYPEGKVEHRLSRNDNNMMAACHHERGNLSIVLACCRGLGVLLGCQPRQHRHAITTVLASHHHW